MFFLQSASGVGSYSFLILIILLVVLFLIYFFVFKSKKKQQQGLIEKEIKLSNPNHEIIWKSARKGVIIFMVIHFLYEILIGNNQSTSLLVMVNFFISRWYIKNQIEKEKQMEDFLLWGLAVSCIVFLIRLILGTLYIYLIRK
jgi:heme/copper-type cytochrome/quinol oxidase subunit 2